MDKLKLEPTAALVMQWSLELYNEETVLRFINHLDLSSGKILFEKCDAVCAWYKEIILNRKSFIKKLIEQELDATKQEHQIVLLAAGKSPLSLEILLNNSSRVSCIYEIEVSGMEEKKKAYRELFPEFQNKLEFIDADIVSPDITSLLERAETGYRHDLPTIVVLEGISYYLRKQELQDIISQFLPQKQNTIIIEYLVPYRFVNPARRCIPKEIFSIIRDDCGLNAITAYTKDELRSLFLARGGDIAAVYTMADMELARTGVNTFFKKPGYGWIECVVGKSGV
jgi:hypothetical protein